MNLCLLFLQSYRETDRGQFHYRRAGVMKDKELCESEESEERWDGEVRSQGISSMLESASVSLFIYNRIKKSRKTDKDLK